MNIYTYYEDVSFNKQKDLIDIWKQSWQNYGFTPVVLGRSDAEKSHFFNDYLDFVRRVHREVSGHNLDDSVPESKYWLAAHLEIPAFHTISEPSYFSDYDMINNGFTDTKFVTPEQIKWLDDDCPCFCSGDSSGWEKYLLFLFDNEDKIIHFLKDRKDHTDRDKFGDQDFLEAVFQDGLKKNIFTTFRNRFVAGEKYHDEKKNMCGVVHISHNNCMDIKDKNKKFKNFEVDELRIHCAKDILNLQKNQILNLSSIEFHHSDIIQSLNKRTEPHAPHSFEGNCLYKHASFFEVDIDKESLRNNIFQLSKYANRILEIGIGAGYSSALYFFANPEVEVVGIDNCELGYTLDCCKTLSNNYNFTLARGDCKDLLKNNMEINGKFDIIHLDCGDTKEDIINYVIDCKKFANVNGHFDSTILIINDTIRKHVKHSINELIESKIIRPVTQCLCLSNKVSKSIFHKFFIYAK